MIYDTIWTRHYDLGINVAYYRFASSVRQRCVGNHRLSTTELIDQRNTLATDHNAAEAFSC